MKELFGIFGRKKEVAPATPVQAESAQEVIPAPATDVSAQAQGGAEVLQNIINKMGFETRIMTQEKEGNLCYELQGEDMGRLIGKEGNTLNALQQLLGSILSRRQGGRVFVRVDANKYRERREQTLRRMARDAAQMALRQQQSVELEPMAASERRVIHDELTSWKDVHTYSTGEMRDRRIIVAPGPAPAIQAQPKEEDQPSLQEQQA
jgi:spoIIIJ-associated protein